MGHLIETVEVKLEHLVMPDGWRDGLDMDHVRRLAEAIKAGQTMPPVRLNAQTELIQGRHRVAAHEEAGRAKIRADIVEYESSEEERADFLAENLYRRKLPPAEERKALAELVRLRMAIAKHADELMANRHESPRSPGRHKDPRRQAIRHVAAETGRSPRAVDRAAQSESLLPSSPAVRPRPSAQSRILRMCRDAGSMLAEMAGVSGGPALDRVMRALEELCAALDAAANEEKNNE